MSRRVRPLLGLVAACVLLVAVALWLGDTPDPVPGPPCGMTGRTPERVDSPSPASVLPQLEPEAPAPLDIGSPAVLGDMSEEAPAAARLEGRVLRRADRSPVADVVVWAVLWSDEQEGDEQERRLPLRTDGEGRFETDLPVTYWPDELVVGAGVDTIPAVTWALEDPGPGEPWRAEVLVDGGLQLQGGVVDVAGVPVAGARVRVWLAPDGWPEADVSGAPDREGTTDGAGQFRLDVLGPGFVVDAVAPGQRSRRLLIGRATAGRLTLERPFVLAPERWIDVQARDLADRPVRTSLVGRHEPGVLQSGERATALAEVHWELPPEVAVDTDERGRGRLGPLTDAPWRVSVVDTRFPRWRRLHAPGDGPLTAVLGRGVEVAGRVTDPAGRPIPGARVEFECQTGQRGTETDVDGRFRVTDVDDGPVGYGAWAPGFALRRHTHWRGDEPLPITLEPAAELTVEVVDGQGTPLEGVTVLPKDWRFDLTWIERMVPGTRSTDGRGRVSLAGLAAGEQVLSLEHRPTRRRREVLVTSGPGLQRVVLEDPGRLILRGRVTEAGSGAPITRFRIARRLTGPGATGGFSQDRQDPQGRFEWTVPAEPVRFTVSAEGYASWSLESLPLEGDVLDLDVELHAVRSLLVLLRDAQGRPLRGRLTAADVGGGTPRPLRLGPFEDTWSDDEGRALIPGLPATLVEVTASHRALGAEVSQRVDLSAPGEQRLELVLEAGPRRRQSVVVFEGGDAVVHRAGLASPWTLLQAHGRDVLRPVSRAVEVRVRRPDGELLQELVWTAEQAGAPRRYASQPELGVRPAELELPAEPLRIEVCLPGGEPLVAGWEPADGGSARRDPLVFVLPR